MNKLVTLFFDEDGNIKKRNAWITVAVVVLICVVQIVAGAFSKRNSNGIRYEVDKQGQIQKEQSNVDPAMRTRQESLTRSSSLEDPNAYKQTEPDAVLAKGGVVVGYDISTIIGDCAMYKPVPVQNVTLTSNIDSGKFQLANRMFTLPAPLSLLTDNGVCVVAINGSNTMATPERKLDPGSFAKIVLYYRGCIFDGEVWNYGKAPVDILEGQLIRVSEDSKSASHANNTNHLFAPGGIGIGTERTNIISVHKEPSRIGIVSAFSDDSVYVYGDDSPFSKSGGINYTTFTVDASTDKVSYVLLMKKTAVLDVPIIDSEQPAETEIDNTVSSDEAPVSTTTATIRTTMKNGTTGTAVKIGESTYSYVTDAQGNVVKDYSTAPVSLSVSYTDEELSSAGFEASDSGRLSIYRYDDESETYYHIGGKVNKDGHCVNTSISKPGEYIIAIDTTSETSLPAALEEIES